MPIIHMAAKSFEALCMAYASAEPMPQNHSISILKSNCSSSLQYPGSDLLDIIMTTFALYPFPTWIQAALTPYSWTRYHLDR